VEHPVNWPLAGAATVAALPGLATAAHLGTLATASLFYRKPANPRRTTVRFCVLVPAHDEAAVLGATLDAVNADRRPGDLVVVVADRCRDRTADIAREHGARVLERPPEAPPGRAAARHDGVQFALTLDWDALMWLDADSIIAPGYVAACADAFTTGAVARQARCAAARGARLVDQAALASFALQGVTMPRGRDRLGLLVRLRGTGMVVTRAVAELPQTFRAPASEDLWYSLDLCLAGIRPRHVEGARLRSQNAGDWSTARAQKERYEAGRMSAARAFVGPLLRRHSPASLEAALFLLSPPFAIAILSLVSGLALSVVAGWAIGLAVLAGALAVIAGALAVALVQARVGWRTWAALGAAPWYVAWKIPVQLRALVGLGKPKVYGATRRQSV
jgi:hypothetical protein